MSERETVRGKREREREREMGECMSGRQRELEKLRIPYMYVICLHCA